MLEEYQVRTNIGELKRYWSPRNRKFKDWFEILVLIDILFTKGLETYVSNEPQTFYNMAHYLLTKGDLSHSAPVETESAMELDRRARINRACEYMWSTIDRERQLGGNQSYIDELGFYLLVLGWYSTVSAFNQDTGLLNSQLWNPYDVYPRYANNRMTQCVHSYKITREEAIVKAEDNLWRFEHSGITTGEVILDDYFIQDKEGLHNMILIDNRDVTGWVDRPEMMLLVAPVGGFPDRGSLTPGRKDWKQLSGRGIFEVNSQVGMAFNKWKSQVSQVLRDTVNPITQEFSTDAQATPEQLRERGAHFHYSPNDRGLERVSPATIPIEVQAHLFELRRELQKGSFSDAVYGMVEGQPGYALSLLASSSANQILYPYMGGKHFIISENDRFWLSKLKTSKRVFEVKGRMIEKLKPTDIADDVSIIVESDVAVAKDWMERATIGNMLDKHLDETTIITEVYHLSDPQAIKRRKSLDRMLEHPMSQMIEMIAGYYAHADYLDRRGDKRQAALFRRGAQALEAQMGVPPAGSAKISEASEVQAAREAGAPAEVARVSPRVSPPEAQSGFTPQQLRQMVGRGSLKTR